MSPGVRDEMVPDTMVRKYKASLKLTLSPAADYYISEWSMVSRFDTKGHCSCAGSGVAVVRLKVLAIICYQKFTEYRKGEQVHVYRKCSLWCSRISRDSSSQLRCHRNDGRTMI